MRVAGVVLASTIVALGAGGGFAVAQDGEVEGTSSTGTPAIEQVRASTFGSSLFVFVICADNGPDCSGTVSARSLNPARALDSQPFTVPTGMHEELRLPIKGAAYTKLRSTGKLRVTVNLTSLGGAADKRTVTVTARKKKPKKKKSTAR